MKKLLILLLTVLTTVCFAQVSVQITIPNPIDANTANWTNGFVVTATTQKTYERCFLILTIKGPVNCGSLTPQSAPTFTLEANKPKVFSAQNAIALFGTNCVLTPGSYTLEATVYYLDKPLGTPASRQFVIKKEEPAAQVNLSINMPNPIDASTANWTNGFLITATTKNPLDRCRLILTIKGKVNCGTLTPQSAPTFTLEANKPKPFAGPNAIALFGTNCVLEPGSYELIATLYFNDRPTGTASRPFEIRKEELANYQPPQAISPADGTVINEADAKKPVTFRWIPVTPKPKDPVTYKLRIYEVKQGQTATAIVKSAIPLHEKDIINQTQYVLPSLSQLNATKGSSFAWTVQALGVKGTPVGGNNGMSGVITLKSGEDEININIDSLKVQCCENGQQLIRITVKNNLDNTNTKVTQIVIDAVNSNYSTPYPVDISSSVLPALPYSYLPSSTSLSQGRKSFTALIDCNLNINTTEIRAYGERLVGTNPRPYGDDDGEIDTLNCLCNDCDSVNIEYVDTSYTKVNSNTYNLTGTLDVNIPIYGVEFQVVSWEYTATPPSCTNGVNSLEQSAMLLLPSTTVNGNVPVACDVSIPGNNANAVKCVKYLSSTPITDPLFNLTLGLPGAMPGLPINCCAIKYKVCVKATVFLDAEHCNYCSYIDCFEFDNH